MTAFSQREDAATVPMTQGGDSTHRHPSAFGAERSKPNPFPT